MSAHTPGPWYVYQPREKSLPHIRNAEGLYVMDAPDRTGKAHAQVRQMADAHLIAAAPELLDALKALHSICTRCDLDQPHPAAVTEAEYQGTMDAVEAAIAKAEGR